MKTSPQLSVLTVVFTCCILGLTVGQTMAATTPSLGTAASFSILTETFTNTIGGTIINGNLGYIIAPAMTPTVNGNTYAGASATITTATADQDSALINLNSQTPCTDIGVSLLNAYSTGSNAPGTFSPGCYSSVGAMTTAVGPVNVTLSGVGTYIFRPGGALDLLANVNIVLTNGASACDVFWTPIGATTIGADNNFIGTVIGTPALTVGNNVTWIGRALNNGASSSVTFSAGNASITAPTCLYVRKQVVNTGGGTGTASDFNLYVKTSTGVDVAGSPASGSDIGSGKLYTLSSGAYVVSEDVHASYTASFSLSCLLGGITLARGDNTTCIVTNTYIVPPATLHVIKTVVGGTASSSDFILSVKTSTGINITGSPASGTITPGIAYTGLAAGTYSVSEDANTSYTASFTGDCDAAGSVTLAAGQDKTCTIINTYIPPIVVVVPIVSQGGGGGGSSLSIDTCNDGDYSPSYYDEQCGMAPTTGSIIVTTTPSAVNSGTSITTTPVSVTTGFHYAAPGFPKTGIPLLERYGSWTILLLAGILLAVGISLVIIFRKKTA